MQYRLRHPSSDTPKGRHLLPRSGRRHRVRRCNFEIQRISFIVLILFMQRGIFLFELFVLVIEFSQILSIKYSYLTNRIIALSLIRWTNKRILSYSVESDGFSKKNRGVSRRGRIDCSPQANYAFSRILGSEAATRYWMTVRGTVRPAAWPSRSETRGTAGSGVMSSLLRKGGGVCIARTKKYSMKL